ncbi:MAG: hypothetical protein FWF35_04705 [Elusimicrobia bacterium]|nr:hypothetical protein [Elusimicrobiota bacterium]
MDEKAEIFQRHFKTGFLKASAVFAIWFVIYNTVVLAAGLLSKFFIPQTSDGSANMLLFLIFYAVSYYALWVGIVLIFGGKFNKTDFIRTAARQWWFLAVIFIFQALLSYSSSVLTYMTQNNIMTADNLFKNMQLFFLAVGAVKIFFTCMFLITARLGVSLTVGVKEKLKDNWRVIAVFLSASVVFSIIALGGFWVFGMRMMGIFSGWGGRILMLLLSFVPQYVQYVFIPFIALPFVVMPPAASSEKTN